MNHPNEPTSSDTPWEEAMSRDFDARVRDLHEAPLDVLSVKGKARKIRRNRRAAVAGGVLGVAAVITPIAVLSNGGDTRTKEPDFAPSPTTTVSDPAADDAIDYVADGVWHQADGDDVTLPQNDNPYDAAVLWNDQLVATRWDGEVYSFSDVISPDGDVVDTLRTTSSVVTNDAGTTIAWIDPDTSEVMTAWDGGQVSVGTVGMAAPGETVAWEPAAIRGGADCLDNDEVAACVVYLNSNLGEESRRFDSQGIDDIVAPSVTKVFDATDDGTVTVINEVTDDLDTCGGPLDLVDRTLRWTTCDYQTRQISPDGAFIAAPPSQFDGLGPSSISVLNAATGEETARYAPEGGFIGNWAWTTDGQLLFDAYDGANWHLFSMAPAGGAITEIGDPVKGKEFDSPFTLIQH